MATQKPLLVRSGLTNTVWVVTRYKHRENGLIEALEKHDVTDQFVALTDQPTTDREAVMDGVGRIAAERRNQTVVKGWTPEHDDEHDNGELIDAALCYADAGGGGDWKADLDAMCRTSVWPWDESWWKPSRYPIRNLEKAGALIAAEIDRLLRKRDTDVEQKLDDMGVAPTTDGRP